MTTRHFALIFGAIFLLVGIAGFIPGLMQMPHTQHPQLQVDAYYGLLFGLFPVNVLHNAVHLLFGVWGLAAYRGFGGPQGVAVIEKVTTLHVAGTPAERPVTLRGTIAGLDGSVLRVTTAAGVEAVTLIPPLEAGRMLSAQRSR